MKMPTHIVAGAGVVENENGEVLLVKTYNNGWVFPGGQIEEGENLIEGIKREIFEESGVEVYVEKLFAVTSNTCKYKGHSGVDIVPTKVMMDFTCKYIKGDLTTSDETSEVAWVKKEDALALIEREPIKIRFQAYLDFKGAPEFIHYVTKPNFILKDKRGI